MSSTQAPQYSRTKFLKLEEHQGLLSNTCQKACLRWTTPCLLGKQSIGQQARTVLILSPQVQTEISLSAVLERDSCCDCVGVLTEVGRVVVGRTVQSELLQVRNQTGHLPPVDALTLTQHVELQHTDRVRQVRTSTQSKSVHKQYLDTQWNVFYLCSPNSEFFGHLMQNFNNRHICPIKQMKEVGGTT